MPNFLRRLVNAIGRTPNENLANQELSEALERSLLKPSEPVDIAAQARLRARQQELRDKLDREGKLALTGYRPPKGELYWGVEAVWRRYGWRPSAETKRLSRHEDRETRIVPLNRR